MLKRTKRLTEIFHALVEWKVAVTKLPNIKAVGCKIRLGLNESEQRSQVYLRAVDAANEAGLDYITVHGRHAGQRSRSFSIFIDLSFLSYHPLNLLSYHLQ